jgi:mannose/fructose/N-acetylgalactosamine-specific phosphotransferase system component IIC
VGASIGCLLAVVLLNELAGTGAIVATTALAALSAFVLSLDSANRTAKIVTGLALVIAAFGLYQQITVDWLRLNLTKKYNNTAPVFIGWNTFSRISVYDDPWFIPFGWGISQTYFEGV